MFMATLDGSIVIIALPAIFRGIHLDPLAPGSISYLLWMIMGYRLVQAVLVVTVGRLGDMFGRVRIYISGPFQHGLVIVFVLAGLAALASALRGARPPRPTGTDPPRLTRLPQLSHRPRRGTP
jgi:MFS family permease